MPDRHTPVYRRLWRLFRNRGRKLSLRKCFLRCYDVAWPRDYVNTELPFRPRRTVSAVRRRLRITLAYGANCQMPDGCGLADRL